MRRAIHGFRRVWGTLVLTLLVFGGTRAALAGFVEEVQADAPEYWWRLDESPGDAIAADMGENFDDGTYVDVSLGEPGLILADPTNTAAGFDGALSGVTIPDSQGLNLGGPFEEKSIVLWFKPEEADSPTEQIIFDEGGATRGLNIYVRDGEVFVGAWNRADDDGLTTPWIGGDPEEPNLYVSAPISNDQIYQVALVMAGDPDGNTGTLTGYLNGELMGEATGVGLLFAHSNDNAIGFMKQNSYFDTAVANGDGNYYAGIIDEVALYNTALTQDRIQAQYVAGGGTGGGGTQLQAGDANMDLEFNQLDLVKVQIAAKYLTGQPATWGEGDWDGAPGGSVGNPPQGNGLFDQIDIIAALGAAIYLKGPYGAIAPGGMTGDGQTSVVYNTNTGELSVDAPAGTELTSINIDSAASIFTGDAAENLGGSFDNDADNNIFKATFGGSFGSLSFGNVAQAGLSEDFVANDLTVVGSLAGGGDLGAVDLVYVPEPAAALLLALGLVACLVARRRARA